jgi:Tfp pilus assembly protein PilF
MTLVLETPLPNRETTSEHSKSKSVAIGIRDLCVTLIALTCLVFWNSFSGQFVFDDILQITDNPNIRQLWPLADWQRPLGYFTFQLNYALGGLNPWGYHLINLLIHLANGLLLFDLARRCIERVATDDKLRSRAKYLAFAIAAVWLVHPLTTTAVTYTVQRLESLMTLCFLGCLYALLRSADSTQPRRWQFAAIVAMALGVLTKEVMITCLPVALLFDGAIVSRSWQGVWKRKGFYLLLALPLAWTFITMRMTNAEEYNAGFGFSGVTPWEYLRSQPLVLLHYLRLTFWPDQLLLDYGWPVENDNFRIFLPGALILALFAGSLVALWKHPPLGFVAVAAFLILAPSSSFMPIADLCFEHRMYLPLMCLATLAVCGTYAFLETVGAREKRTPLAVGCLLLAMLALGYRTMLRNADYADPIKLWEKNVAAKPNHARPHLLLAILYDRAGRAWEAGAQYQAAVAAKPNYFKGLLNLGGWHYRQGKFSQAAACFARATASEPQNAVGYMQQGRALLELGDASAAKPLLEKSLQLEPVNPVALRALAWLLCTARESDLRDGQRAMKLLQHLPPDPKQQDVWRLDVLASAQAELQDFAAAVETMELACSRAAEQGRPEALQAELRARLASYQQATPWRLKAQTQMP